MLTLGVETSCDETSVALVEDGRVILSNVVASQVELHRQHGGVVPELAARAHLERLPLVTDAALSEAGRGLAEVGLVAVTRGPGLGGALLVGVGFARGLALDRGLPIVGVSHLDGHVRSAFLEAPEAETPMLVLVVSGGHTELVLLPGDGSEGVLGRTLDDAAGEAFDKVARMLGLPYPGGPEVDRVARGVAGPKFPLPRIQVEGLDFSFSGLKTAVRYALEKRPLDGDEAVAAAAASFQERAIEHLLETVGAALDSEACAGVRTLAIAGGVAANRALREAAAILADERGVRLVIPALPLCGDNAAMIAAAGNDLWQAGRGMELSVDPGLNFS